MELVRDTFLDDETNCILSIPPSRRSDSLCWHYDKHDHFTVKNTYWLGIQVEKSSVGSSSFRSTILGWWRFLWHLSIPPKIKLFVYRAFLDWIPTLGNVAHRNLQVAACV
ncbi:hypothetical protein ACOSP7_031472 [Xanthoceras sorbifolium]